MGKYDPLGVWLSKLPAEQMEWRFGFEDLRAVLGFLPNSAHNHAAWWHDASTGQAKAWLSAGWHLRSLDLKAKVAILARGNASKAPRASRGSAFHDESLAMPGEPEPGVSLSLEWQWEALGRLKLDDQGKVVFPRPPETGGLYRFEFQGRRVYIGEASNFPQRFRGYRSPGVGTPTNLRLNELFLAALEAEEPVRVSLVCTARIQGAVWDLAQKWNRVLVEHAAIHESGQAGLELLNL